MISGFEKYHLLIDLQYFYGSFERSFLFHKMSFKVVLFVQSKLRVNASHILCWALADFIGLKWRLFTTFTLCLFCFNDYIFFSSLGSSKLVNFGQGNVYLLLFLGSTAYCLCLFWRGRRKSLVLESNINPMTCLFISLL